MERSGDTPWYLLASEEDLREYNEWSDEVRNRSLRGGEDYLPTEEMVEDMNVGDFEDDWSEGYRDEERSA